MRLMHPRPGVVGPQLRLAGIDVNHRHRRRMGMGPGQLPGLELFDLPLGLVLPLPPQTLGDLLHVLVADGQVRQPPQGPRRLLERMAVGPGEFDLGHQRRAVVFRPKVQPLVEEKNLRRHARHHTLVRLNRTLPRSV